MTKKRVHELGKQLKEHGIELSNQELVDKLHALGYLEVKSHSSSLEDDQASAALDKILAERKPRTAPARPAGPGFVVRRKAHQDGAASAEARHEAVEQQPPPAPAEPPRERGRAAGAFGGGIGLVPEITPVVSLRARGSIGARWELGVGAQLWVESRTSGMGFGLTTASADVCVIPLEGVRALRWCAGGHLGFLHVAVHAAELAPVTVGMVPWAGAETGPHLSLPLMRDGPFRLEAGVSAIVPITRREAFVRGRPDVVWEQSVVGGRAELGVGASF